MPNQNLAPIKQALKWAPELDIDQDLSFLLRDYPDERSERDAFNALSWGLIDGLNAMEGVALGSARNAARHALLMAVVLRQRQWLQSSQTPPEQLQALADSVYAYLRAANAWREVPIAQAAAESARERAEYWLRK